MCYVQRVASDYQYIGVEHNFLLSSVCRSYLPWMSECEYKYLRKSNNCSGIIAFVDGCGLERTESDLKDLLSRKGLISKDCLSHGLLFVCSYFYRHLVNGTFFNKYWPTRDQCTAVRSEHCRQEWSFVEEFQKSRNSCIRLPDCTQLPAHHQNLTARGLLEFHCYIYDTILN